ncbi:hypothetical protein FRACYDRAFT_239907 [Fragilariopsis cylindrus CCMP1102]|uniref:Uncharacterized protein n=1 Tax=Fragilariopsis cylindrus CCMP1102 TaxID=635003 RepID=A0A1E7FAM7_9STRA|nr:hypothetical protein FRACYDRAFT_239907 [Fragilariopsis cylindrus CCMP1102]|eukprot:OEU15230.1 hypothetical protein FRACYDRAFT_239907 [Fragilariopsis cylindrus CCMP1102]
MDQWDAMVTTFDGSGAVRAAGNQEATTAASSSPPHSPHNSFIAAASSTAASLSRIRRLRAARAKIIVPKNLMNLLYEYAIYERIFSKVAALSSPDAYPGIKTKNSSYPGGVTTLEYGITKDLIKEKLETTMLTTKRSKSLPLFVSENR